MKYYLVLKIISGCHSTGNLFMPDHWQISQCLLNKLNLDEIVIVIDDLIIQWYLLDVYLLNNIFINKIRK